MRDTHEVLDRPLRPAVLVHMAHHMGHRGGGGGPPGLGPGLGAGDQGQALEDRLVIGQRRREGREKVRMHIGCSKTFNEGTGST